MKKIISSTALCMMILFSQAQITFRDSIRGLTLSGYIGTLSGPNVTLPKGTVSGFGNIRAGGFAQWHPKQWFVLSGFGVIQVTNLGQVIPMYMIGTTFSPTQRISITAGRIASPMTELRPLPYTGPGQFEPWTKAQIVNPALGGKMRMQLDSANRYSITVGGFYRTDSTATVEAGIGLPYVRIASAYTIQAKTFSVAGEVVTKWFSNTTTYNHNQLLGNVTVVFIPKTNGLMLYSDIGFATRDWKLIRGEWGALKSFNYKFVKGLFGMGYAHETTSINGYFMINL